jgi:hypothetical protein
VLAYSVLAHSTNLMLCVALLVVCAAWRAWRKDSVNPQALIGVAACVLVGFLGQLAFNQAVKATTGHPPVRPPFIAMRLIADGPGYAYLQKHCPDERIIYCRALSHPRLPSDTLLWSSDPKTSLFRGLTPDEQRASAAEQKKFAAAVIAERPLDVIAAAARNSAVQLLSLDLVNFNYSDENRERFEKTIPAQSLNAMKQTRAYNGRMPTALAAAGTALLSVASLAFLLPLVARNGKAERQPLRGYCLCIVAAILINAAICGALSGPKGRYQMRLIWILPVVAAAAAWSSSRLPALGRRRASDHPGQQGA